MLDLVSTGMFQSRSVSFLAALVTLPNFISYPAIADIQRTKKISKNHYPEFKEQHKLVEKS
jgi:hypothetical protein